VADSVYTFVNNLPIAFLKSNFESYNCTLYVSFLITEVPSAVNFPRQLIVPLGTIVDISVCICCFFVSLFRVLIQSFNTSSRVLGRKAFDLWSISGFQYLTKPGKLL